MKIKFSIIVCLLTVLLSGCRIGPRELFYPGSLDGTIKNGVYSARIGRLPSAGTFHVGVPQANNKYEYPFLRTEEEFNRDSTYVSFGPESSDATLYRILVGDKRGMSLRLFKDRCFRVLIDKVARGDDRQMDKIYEEDLYVNGHPAIFEVFTQNVAGYYHYYNHFQTGDIILTHAVYFIDYGRYGAVIWIQASSDSGINDVNGTNRYQLIHGIWKPQIRLLRSFVVFCGTDDLCRL